MKRKSVSKIMRSQVLHRDGNSCVYCGISGDEVPLEMDHRVPISKGGSNKMSNLLSSCRKCNVLKADKIWAIPLKTRSIPEEAKKDPLVGKFLHLFKSRKPTDREVEFLDIKSQGQIIGIHNERLVVQLFSWANSKPEEIILVTGDSLDQNNSIIYPNEDAMKNRYQELIEKEVNVRNSKISLELLSKVAS